MKTKLLVILLFSSFSAFSKEIIIFEDNNYKLYNKVNLNCSSLRLYNKKLSKSIGLKYPIDGSINLADRNCFSEKIKKVFWLVSIQVMQKIFIKTGSF